MYCIFVAQFASDILEICETLVMSFRLNLINKKIMVVLFVLVTNWWSQSLPVSDRMRSSRAVMAKSVIGVPALLSMTLISSSDLMFVWRQGTGIVGPIWYQHNSYNRFHTRIQLASLIWIRIVILWTRRDWRHFLDNCFDCPLYQKIFFGFGSLPDFTISPHAITF